MSNTFRIMLAMLVGTFALLLSLQHAVAQEKPDEYTDSKYEFSITVPPDWKSARLQGYAVPGIARAAYARPDGVSIVLFVQEPGRAFEPRFLVDESAKSMDKNLGATIVESGVREVGGKKAMWLIVEGKGTGVAIDGKGSVKTSQHWIAIPREKDVIVALLTSPTADFEEHDKSFIEIIKTLKVGGKQTAAQSESK